MKRPTGPHEDSIASSCRLRKEEINYDRKKRKQLYQTKLTPEAKLCTNCKHFYQHYNDKGDKVQCGHCTYPRLKTRMPYDTCDTFLQKEGSET